MSFITFFFIVSLISCPPIWTGLAEPIFVDGAIAAMSAAIVIIAPAEAALAPGG